ncbi:hypothetical protein Dda_8010 [Drechslerella dactyloides]|uniref:Inner centromere protein ARK-binding domain-containing protein n=1 Tax=Drechslerella dactyloides TaxID=74499 RepID=A0AAD6NG49_DREDA|nr:hypothetical protein Dda_8010 [Drechslerella dactyloides]
MASRTALPDVGSPRWIFNELTDAHQKEADHFEDFTIAIRNELEWLHEHMAEIFHQGSEIDIADLYKTPGKLRGKTPRVIRKLDSRNEQDDDYLLPTDPVNPPTPLAISRPHNVHTAPQSSDSKASTPDLIGDTEAWSGSSAVSISGSFGISTSEPIERSSPAKKPLYQNAPDIVPEIAERRTFSDATRRSFLSAREGYSDTVGQSPEPPLGATHFDIEVASNNQLEEAGSNETPSKTYHGIPTIDRDAAANTLDADADPIPQLSDPRTPLNLDTRSGAAPNAIREFSISPVQVSAVTPASPISPIEQHDPIMTPKPILSEPVIDSETPSESASPIAIAATNTMARGSMNFASLPARETLTHKKSMGGSNPTSRSSHVDDRTSIFGRLTGGKSLGASGIMGEAGLADVASAPGTAVVQPVLPNTLDDDDDDDDLNEQLRLAEINKASSVMHLSEKTSTQRLNEKISKLSQQGSNRLSKSTSTSSISMSSQCDDKEHLNTRIIDNKSAKELPSRARESTQSDEGDWIPSLPQAQRPQPMAPTTYTLLPPPSDLNPSEAAILASPKPIMTTPASTKLPIPISTAKKTLGGNVVYPQLPTAIPKPLPLDSMETPPSKVAEDLDINTAKKNQANIFSFAKQLLWRSGRVESPRQAQSKRSPPKNENIDRSPSDQPPSDQSPRPTGASKETPKKPLYPDIQEPMADPARDSKQVETPRSPIRQQVLYRSDAPSLEAEDINTHNDMAKGVARSKIPPQMITEGLNLLHQNADSLLQSPIISDNDPSLPGSPFSDSEKSEHGSYQDDGDVKLTATSHRSQKEGLTLPQTAVKATPSRDNLKEPRGGASIQAKFSDIKKTGRGLFGVKDAGIAKPKNNSSNIRLVTASQREMDQRKVSIAFPLESKAPLLKNSQNGPPNIQQNSAALAGALAETFGLRVPKSIAALNSAAKAQKRHASDEDDTKKRPNATNKAMQPLLNPSKLLPKATLFSQKPVATASKSYHEVKRQQKRLFPGDDDHKSQKEDAGPSVTSSQDSKRRKTEDSGETPMHSAFAPPIRPSTAKKENTLHPKIGGIFSQDYTPAAPSHAVTNHGPSLVKSSLLPPQTSKTSAALPLVDVVKYSHDKLKFGTMATPAPQKTGIRQSAVSHESPLTPNPETIELPEIHTDSEDDHDERTFRVPKWADSPELRQALQDQLGIDPETIFGPIAPLSMDDIFKGRADRAKFRARTSSANWSGADRLTAAEIEADKIERQRILDNGGWTYQKPR